MMNVEERVFAVTWEIKGMKCQKFRDNLEKKFHNKFPTDKAIRNLLTKFQRHESVHDDSRNGRPSKAGERIEFVIEAFGEDPQLSTRRASSTLEIPSASNRRILRCDSGKIIPYQIQVFHNLQEEDYPLSAAMCAELNNQI